VDGLAPPLDLGRSQVLAVEVSLDVPIGLLTDEHPTRWSQGLKPGGQIRRVALGRIVHAEVVPNRGNDHLTGVHADPQLEVDLLLPVKLLPVGAQGRLHL
jgi:hypothetical protein